MAGRQSGGVRAWMLPNGGCGTVLFSADLSAGNAYTTALVASHSPVTLVASGSLPAASVPTAAQALPNRITLNRALTKAFPSGTLASSVLLLGDLQASVGGAFSQGTWTDVWSDSRIGSAIAAQYQQVANPIVVSNVGAVTERWALIFTSSTAYRVVGETLGQIATGDINTDLAPVNPATSAPYFTVLATGWGSGWSAGNVLRFATTGANAPVWASRVTLPSVPSSTPDSLTLAVRGDINA